MRRERKNGRVIQLQPGDAWYEGTMRQLAFERMTEGGLDDSRQGKAISNEELGRPIRTWQK